MSCFSSFQCVVLYIMGTQGLGREKSYLERVSSLYFCADLCSADAS